LFKKKFRSYKYNTIITVIIRKENLGQVHFVMKNR